MEKMPFRESMAVEPTMATPTTQTAVVSSDWKKGLPVLTSSNVTLRELRLSDAASLLTMLTTEEVARFISPPPTTVAGFERFIVWAHAERQAGRYACFAVVPAGSDTAVGIFQGAEQGRYGGDGGRTDLAQRRRRRPPQRLVAVAQGSDQHVEVGAGLIFDLPQSQSGSDSHQAIGVGKQRLQGGLNRSLRSGPDAGQGQGGGAA